MILVDPTWLGFRLSSHFNKLSEVNLLQRGDYLITRIILLYHESWFTIFKIKTQTCETMFLNGRKCDFEWSDLMVKKFEI